MIFCKILMILEAIISKEKLTEMRVDSETKTAFITDKGGQLLTFDFNDVRFAIQRLTCRLH